SQDPEDAIEDTSVVHPRNATWLVRQHRPYGSPFIVGEFVAHDSSPQSGSLNHRGLTHRKELLARPWFGVFGAGADINLPTILNETVESDRLRTFCTTDRRSSKEWDPRVGRRREPETAQTSLRDLPMR